MIEAESSIATNTYTYPSERESNRPPYRHVSRTVISIRYRSRPMVATFGTTLGLFCHCQSASFQAPLPPPSDLTLPSDPPDPAPAFGRALTASLAFQPGFPPPLPHSLQLIMSLVLFSQGIRIVTKLSVRKLKIKE